MHGRRSEKNKCMLGKDSKLGMVWREKESKNIIYFFMNTGRMTTQTIDTV